MNQSTGVGSSAGAEGAAQRSNGAVPRGSNMPVAGHNPPNHPVPSTASGGPPNKPDENKIISRNINGTCE